MKIITRIKQLSCIFLLLSYSLVGYSDNQIYGTIKGHTYTNQITLQPEYGKFSIDIPQYYPGINYHSVRMRDCISKEESCAFFGPSTRDTSYYRFAITPTTTTSLATIKDKIVADYLERAVNEYGGTLKEIYSIKTTYRGYPAYYQVYTQSSPGIKAVAESSSELDKEISQHIAQKQTYTHALLLVDYNSQYGLVFWLQTTDLEGSTNPYAVTEVNRKEIINRTWAPWRDFMNSFKLEKK